MLKDFLKYGLVALIMFVCYNEFLIMYRESAFNGIEFRADKASVVHAIGEPQYIYLCGTGEQAPAFLPYIETLCDNNAREVDAFPLCRIPFRCRGWNYVSFDGDNKSLVKYHMAY